MERVAVEDVAPDDLGDGSERRRLADPLGATDVALVRYRLAPGDALPGGLHAHADQEEVFVVLDGAATFETLLPRDEGAGDDREAGEVTVEAGEAVRFAPGDFQSGRNDGDRDLVVLAIGAPPDSEDVRVPLACRDCGREDVRLDFDEDGAAFVCPDCGDERRPAACPDCGHPELRFALDGDGTVVACPDCGSEFAEPPLAG